MLRSTSNLCINQQISSFIGMFACLPVNWFINQLFDIVGYQKVD